MHGDVAEVEIRESRVDAGPCDTAGRGHGVGASICDRGVPGHAVEHIGIAAAECEMLELSERTSRAGEVV